MDIMPNNDAHTENDTVVEPQPVAPHAHDGQHIGDTPDRGVRPDRLLRAGSELACRSVVADEVREAKLRELQASIANGTYDVPAEQIADKILRRLRRDEPV
jgi:anti-sigma28 factor (negative regulator of flagellin synthesis)